MTNPVFETPEEKPLVTRRILPVYPLTAGLTNKAVSKAVLQALESCGTPPEILPQEVRTQYGILRQTRPTGPSISPRMPRSWTGPDGGWFLRSFLYFPQASA